MGLKPHAETVRRIRIAMAISAGVAASAATAVGGWALWNLKASDLAQRRTRSAGFTESSVEVNGTTLNYALGPTTDGPALLLVHGQGVDWQSYARALPALAEELSVFAVDVHGHGRSARDPEKYSAEAIGADLACFIEMVIRELVIVSGHSSGGQLAAWLAGNRPDLIRAAVLEDPPLFTTLLPRAKKTWNWVDLASICHEFLRSEETNWPAFSFAHQKLWSFFGDSADRIISSGLVRHSRHPDRPIQLFFMPPGWNDMQRALVNYDPRFGEAFYTGTWDQGFDHEQTLRGIEAPTVLVHARWKYGPDGILQGAIDDDDARRIASLIEDVEVVEVDSGHNVHGEKTDQFVEIIRHIGRRWL